MTYRRNTTDLTAGHLAGPGRILSGPDGRGGDDWFVEARML